ncbi:hypothetical protein CMUS01_00102 [Colletotrichum musicola]|uniref:Uncharacterized protein n=1 Tax=Colletotrichum musicola TaxID=2175873 RepID=A0A8H6NZS8_9PEZI|nr:hypothetical protein CMUS01_00102 [Colletotrichum musicola]
MEFAERGDTIFQKPEMLAFQRYVQGDLVSRGARSTEAAITGTPSRLVHRYYNTDVYGYYRRPLLSIFDQDISDLSSNADSEKCLAKFEDDCDCASDVSDCKCKLSWEEETEDEDESYGYDKKAFKYVRARRNERKRQLRDQAREEQAKAVDDEQRKLAYEANKRGLIEKIEKAIAAISEAADTPEAREVPNKIFLMSWEYRLIPCNLNYNEEHLAKTMYNSRLQLHLRRFTEQRNPNGEKVPILEGTLTINGMSVGAEHPQETGFIGPDWAGSMMFPTKGDHPDVWVRFHNRDYIELLIHANVIKETIHALDERGQKPPLTLYHGPGGYFAFYGLRFTLPQISAEAAEYKRLYPR